MISRTCGVQQRASQFFQTTHAIAPSHVFVSSMNSTVSFSLPTHRLPFSPHCRYLSDAALLDLRLDPLYWELLRSGFLSTSSAVAKKAGYLLKRLLADVSRTNLHRSWPSFEWQPTSAAELERMWNVLLLLVETTTDFSLHLIQDAWQQLESLFDSPLHPAWLAVVLQRILRHDNPAVKKFALVQILQLNDARVQRLDENFVLNSLLQSLSEPTVYKGTVGERIETDAAPFFLRYWQLVASKNGAQFLRNFVEATRTHLSPPRIHVATAFLSSITTPVPSWGPRTFASLAEITVRKLFNKYVRI